MKSNKDFYKKTENISDHPMDRVSPELKNRLEDDELFFDVHCHIFNLDCVPKKFVFLKMPTNYKNNDDTMDWIEDILHNLRNDTDTDRASHIAYFLDFARKRSVQEVAEKLFTYYPEKTVFCPLMMDMEWGLDSKPNRPYKEQIKEMRKLSTEKYPGKLLPFVAIDPNNPDVFDIFLDAFSDKGGFFGIKIYPSLGYLPSDEKLMRIFEVCEEKNIPVTTHCGGGIVHTTQRVVRIKGKELDENDNLVTREEKHTNLFRLSGGKIAKIFNDPKNWEPVLHTFPKLKLNLAHFGGTEAWEIMLSDKTSNVNRIMDFMYRYPNVYTDFSFNIYNRKFYNILRRRILNNKIIRERVLYGSDFYMVTAYGLFRLMKIDFHTAMGDEIMHQIANVNPKRFLFAGTNQNETTNQLS